MLSKSVALLCVYSVLACIVTTGLYVPIVAANQDKIGSDPQVWYGEERNVEAVSQMSEATKDERSWLKRYKWWVALGVALAALAAAGMTSSDGSDDVPPEPTPSGETGTYSSKW